jgi:APA family basic amino acid/polyamine antiporter
MSETERPIGKLRRDLGTIESYASLIGILICAGIFKVTSQAWLLTGPSVILGYAVLMPAVLATSIPYAAYISSPLGRLPGGEYLHISRTLGGFRLAYIGSWLKIIAYVGAGAYLASAFSDYLLELADKRFNTPAIHLAIALAALVFFYIVHALGVRWFGRLQVLMCALLALSLVVLIVPGLFAVRPSNYSPFIMHGWKGFAASLIPLFFSYAGFEALAQTAGEVKDSTSRLPMIFLKGVSATALIFVLMSAVSFGVLPGSQLAASSAPMSDVAAVYLPRGAAWLITLGAIMAITTSLNPTLIVPSRLAIIFADDGLVPSWLGYINSRTGTPVRALTITLAGCCMLLVSGQLSLALNIAIFALIVLYFLHSLTFLLLPRFNPALYQSISVNIPRWLQRAAAVVSVLSMAILIGVQLFQDVQTLKTETLAERISNHSLTAIELTIIWVIVGLALFVLARWSQKRNAKI